MADGIAVVYPVTLTDVDWHCTIIYLGQTDEVSFTKEDLAPVTDRLKDLPEFGSVKVGDEAMFGPDSDVPVWLLEDTDGRLADVHTLISGMFKLLGIESASEFKDEYRPHITVESHEISKPGEITLGKPTLWWGDNREE